MLRYWIDWLKKSGHQKTILFYDDNATSHTLNTAQAKKHEFNFKSLPHLPYSPDPALSGCYLFPNLIRWLYGRHFETNQEVEWETEGYFGGFDESYYLEGIKKLKDRWSSRIELKAEYSEK